MKLQLALDTLTIEESINLLGKLGDTIDIVEIGTPFIMKEGLHALKAIKEKFPNYIYLADCKIVDGAKIEATDAFESGADIVTVLALADDKTISDTVECAKSFGKKVLCDLINVKDFDDAAKNLLSIGVDYLCVHTAFDLQGSVKPPLEDLKKINKYGNEYSAVAGGVSLQTIADIAKEKPAIIVVGSAITSASDPSAVAKKIKQEMRI